jgi:hypothetical protein
MMLHTVNISTEFTTATPAANVTLKSCMPLASRLYLNLYDEALPIGTITAGRDVRSGLSRR